MGSSRKSGGTLPRGYFGGFLSSNPKIISGKVLVYEVLVCDSWGKTDFGLLL